MIVDIVIIGIIAVAAVIGLALGFYKSIVGFFASGFAFLAAFFSAAFIANALIGIGTIANFLYGPSIFGNLYGFVSAEALANGGIVSAILSPFAGYIADSAAYTYGAVSAHAANIAILVFAIFTAAIALLVFIIVRLILIIFVRLFKKARKGKKPKAASRFFGFLTGGVKGGLFVLMMFIVVGFAVPAIPGAANEINSSNMASPMFEMTATHISSNLVRGGGVIPFNTQALVDRLLSIDALQQQGQSGDEDNNGD